MLSYPLQVPAKVQKNLQPDNLQVQIFLFLYVNFSIFYVFSFFYNRFKTVMNRTALPAGTVAVHPTIVRLLILSS
jgi:hypothetical protein